MTDNLPTVQLLSDTVDPPVVMRHSLADEHSPQRVPVPQPCKPKHGQASPSTTVGEQADTNALNPSKHSMTGVDENSNQDIARHGNSKRQGSVFECDALTVHVCINLI